MGERNARALKQIEADGPMAVKSSELVGVDGQRHLELDMEKEEGSGEMEPTQGKAPN